MNNPDAATDTVAVALGLVWGSAFSDLPHFQYPALTIAQLQERQSNNQTFIENGVTYANL